MFQTRVKGLIKVIDLEKGGITGPTKFDVPKHLDVNFAVLFWRTAALRNWFSDLLLQLHVVQILGLSSQIRNSEVGP